jgi:hypothetical protein
MIVPYPYPQYFADGLALCRTIWNKAGLYGPLVYLSTAKANSTITGSAVRPVPSPGDPQALLDDSSGTNIAADHRLKATPIIASEGSASITESVA